MSNSHLPFPTEAGIPGWRLGCKSVLPNAAGVHLVMLDLKSPLQWGRSYPLTLVFEKAGAIDTMLSVGAH